jgi:ABC-type sugar transport system permease subunit
LPTIVNATMWRYIFNPQYGPLNALLTQAHLIDQYRSWLGSPFLALNMIVLADVWKNTSVVAFFVLAGLQVIPGDLMEAAQMDGAGAVRRFFSITLPLLRPIIAVVLVLRTIEAFKVFDIVYVMTRGGPANGTRTVSLFTYQSAFSDQHFGYGSALSVLIVLGHHGVGGHLHEAAEPRGIQDRHMSSRTQLRPAPGRSVSRPVSRRRRRSADDYASIWIHLIAVVVILVALLPIAWMVIASITPSADLLAHPLRWLPKHPDFSRYREVFHRFRGQRRRWVPGGDAEQPAGGGGHGDRVADGRDPRRLRLRPAALPRPARHPAGLPVHLHAAADLAGDPALPGPGPAAPARLGDRPDRRLQQLLHAFRAVDAQRVLRRHPVDLEEAARLDGCSRLGVLWRIVLPLSQPGIFSAVLFATLLCWDEFLYALIFTNSAQAKTIPVAIAEFSAKFSTDFGLVCVGGLLAAIPPVVVALAFQRFVVAG